MLGPKQVSLPVVDLETPIDANHSMRISLLAFSALFLVPLSSLSGDEAKPLKVFILAGQSNMEGQAVVDLDGKDYNDGKGTLAKLMEDPAKAALFRNLKDESGNWIVRQDVWVRYQREQGP